MQSSTNELNQPSILAYILGRADKVLRQTKNARVTASTVLPIETNDMTLQFQPFVDRHPPDGVTEKPDAAKLARYAGHLPDSLLALWSAHGFGWYGNGLIQIIDPDKYRDKLWGWLMRDEDMDRLPIALGAFGDILYYRKLSDDGDEDVAFIDPHTSQTGVVEWSLDAFFNGWCCDDDEVAGFFDIGLITEAAARKGPLEHDQMYFFVPALRLGGERTAQHVDRGDARVQLDLLLQFAHGSQLGS